MPLINDTHITLRFVNGFINGSAGCNDYFSLDIAGKYQATFEGSLTIRALASTSCSAWNPKA
jgi:heat shock protein HslJ